ncbi:MAG: MFS transporter [Candidatus Lokiarchaeota archaeon]|nr:MFS transporter [Candidatus Lokiarchaeota archaeon]MBD3337940.1 MFS transporter [Candidatus Lokiarchaeota archaeon]
MTSEAPKVKEEHSVKEILAYSNGFFIDTVASQFFGFLIFTFYFTIVGLNINLITVGFIIWSLWDAFNDPMMGGLSDRTKTKWGRRKPYIVMGIIPTAIILVLLWLPPEGSQLTIFIYFIIMTLLYELFYTMFSLNQTALFPEMYQNLEDRAKANNIIQIVGVVGLFFAFLAPSFFIPNYTDKRYAVNYVYAGIFFAIIILIAGFLFVKYGIKERLEYSKDSDKAPSLFNSVKLSLKNKAFRTYVVANFTIYYVFGMLPVITPLYGRFVLNIESAFLLSILLGLAFISAAIFINLWRKVSLKVGIKNGLIYAMIAFIICLVPFMFITEIIGAIIAYFLVGIGLAGAMFFRVIATSTVIDDDELRTGVRREGAYMGTFALINRLNIIAVYLTISIVFNSVGWAVFDPKLATAETVFGLRALIFLFPAIALVIGIISMMHFPINKERYEEIKAETDKLHEQKKMELSA